MNLYGILKFNKYLGFYQYNLVLKLLKISIIFLKKNYYYEGSHTL